MSEMIDVCESLDMNHEFVRINPISRDYWRLKPGDIVEISSKATGERLAISMYTTMDTCADPHDIYGRNDWLRLLSLKGEAYITKAWRRIKVHEDGHLDCNTIGQILPSIFRLEQLMEYKPDPIPVRDLIDSGACNERCLLARRDFRSSIVYCDCRCQGKYHGYLDGLEIQP